MKHFMRLPTTAMESISCLENQCDRFKVGTSKLASGKNPLIDLGRCTKEGERAIKGPRRRCCHRIADLCVIVRSISPPEREGRAISIIAMKWLRKTAPFSTPFEGERVRERESSVGRSVDLLRRINLSNILPFAAAAAAGVNEGLLPPSL